MIRRVSTDPSLRGRGRLRRRPTRAPLATLCGAYLALAAGCTVFGGLTEDEEQRLATYQQNAATYYGGQRFGQALDAVEQGLEIAPDDYKLLAIRGWCYLRTANGDRANLRRAEESFGEVWDQRDILDHDRYVLLGYGRVKQEIGRWHREEAETLAREAADPQLGPTARTTREASAKEHGRKAIAYWRDAEAAFEGLIGREVLLRDAYKALMELAVERGNYEDAVDWGQRCIDRIGAEKDDLKTVISEVMSLPREREARDNLAQLEDQEIRVRAALAEMHYRRENYAAAVEQLDQLLTIDPFRSIDYYNRALAEEKLGREADARRDYDKFLRTTSLPSSDDRVVRAFAWLRGNGSTAAESDR